MSGEFKKDIALGGLVDDRLLGDRLSPEQERLARVAFRANVAFLNSLEPVEAAAAPE